MNCIFSVLQDSVPSLQGEIVTFDKLFQNQIFLSSKISTTKLVPMNINTASGSRTSSTKSSMSSNNVNKKIQMLQNKYILTALCNNNHDCNNRSNISDDNEVDMFTNILQLQKELIDCLKEKNTLLVKNSFLEQTYQNLFSKYSKQQKYFDVFVSKFNSVAKSTDNNFIDLPTKGLNLKSAPARAGQLPQIISSSRSRESKKPFGSSRSDNSNIGRSSNQATISREVREISNEDNELSENIHITSSQRFGFQVNIKHRQDNITQHHQRYPYKSSSFINPKYNFLQVMSLVSVGSQIKDLWMIC